MFLLYVLPFLFTLSVSVGLGVWLAFVVFVFNWNASFFEFPVLPLPTSGSLLQGRDRDRSDHVFVLMFCFYAVISRACTDLCHYVSPSKPPPNQTRPVTSGPANRPGRELRPPQPHLVPSRSILPHPRPLSTANFVPLTVFFFFLFFLSYFILFWKLIYHSKEIIIDQNILLFPHLFFSLFLF